MEEKNRKLEEKFKDGKDGKDGTPDSGMDSAEIATGATRAPCAEASATGASSSSIAAAALSEDTKPLAPMDKRSIKLPEVWNGDVTNFPEWQDGLIDYLDSRDARWRRLLESIESRGKNPVTNADITDIITDTGIGKLH